MKRKSKRETTPEWVSQITALRERLGINQAELARRLECSAMTISRWERGLLQPSAEHFIQLGNLGNRTDAWFLLGDGWNPTRKDGRSVGRFFPNKKVGGRSAVGT